MTKSKLEKELELLNKKITYHDKSLTKDSKGSYSLLKDIYSKIPHAFTLQGIVQQAVGAWVVLLPMTHFEEIIAIPYRMSLFKLFVHLLISLTLSIMIVFYANREEVKREKICGIPVRFFSIIIVCVISTLLTIFIYVEEPTSITKAFIFLFGFALLGSAGADVFR